MQVIKNIWQAIPNIYVNYCSIKAPFSRVTSNFKVVANFINNLNFYHE